MKVHTPITIHCKPPEEMRAHARPYVLAFMAKLGYDESMEFLERNRGANRPQYTKEEEKIAHDVCRKEKEKGVIEKLRGAGKGVGVMHAAGFALGIATGAHTLGLIAGGIGAITNQVDRGIEELNVSLGADDVLKEAYRLANDEVALASFYEEMMQRQVKKQETIAL